MHPRAAPGEEERAEALVRVIGRRAFLRDEERAALPRVPALGRQVQELEVLAEIGDDALGEHWGIDG